jgi:cytochrome c-type biogenesis protein CcmH
MTRRIAWLIAALVLVASAHSARAEAGDAGARAATALPLASVEGEAIVEGRLLAPCCYTQTLDVHQSPMATELRLEVRARLAAGDSQEAVEADFASRYGERVRAVPKGSDPRATMFLIATSVLVVTGLGLVLLLRRWRRTPLDAPRAVSRQRDAFDDRIDAELRDLDG